MVVHVVREKHDIHNETTLDLEVKRKGGGSIINVRPVFSADAKTIFVTTSSIVRAYSTVTGEFVQDYEELKSRAVGIRLNPNNPEHLIACSEKGQLVEWRWKTRLVIKNIDLALSVPEDSDVRYFHLVPAKTPSGSLGYNVMTLVKHRKKMNLKLVVCCGQSGTIKTKAVNFRFLVDNHAHSFAVGGHGGQEFLAGINGKELSVLRLSNQQHKVHMMGSDRSFTCVSCHPADEVLATGDNTGRVLLWHSFLDGNRPSQTVYHWHSLPVHDVVFSRAGSFFYSGGEERVLVKWTMDDVHTRSFLPRLPATICHLVVSPSNKLVATLTADNAVHLVDSHNVLHSVIQHMTWGVVKQRDQRLFPAGMVVDPRTKALVLNGRTGHIQFFCPVSNLLLYNLDITCLNISSDVRHEEVVNMDVTLVAVGGDGRWLATVEERDDRETSPELRLKFWSFDQTEQKYCLNTCVNLPHDGSVLALKFQPLMTAAAPLAVTVGTDCRFRSWSLVPTDSIYKSGECWQCDSVGFFKDLPASDAGFSSDGSLLGVSFASTLTVWVPETSDLKSTLSHVSLQEPITHLEFGQKDLSHLVVIASSAYVAVWDLLSLALLWTADVGVSLLVSDPSSVHVALFTTENSLFVFSPDSPEPVYQHNTTSPSGDSILAAAFVPYAATSPQQSGWLAHSQLYYLDNNQELLTLESKNSSNKASSLTVLPTSENIPLTPFAALMAQHRSSDVQAVKPSTHSQLGVPGAATVREFLSAPAHTMPSLTLLCGAFLRSFVVGSSNQEGSDSVPAEMDEGSDDEGSVRVEESSDETSRRVAHHAESATIDLDKEKRLLSLLKEPMDWAANLT